MDFRPYPQVGNLHWVVSIPHYLNQKPLENEGLKIPFVEELIYILTRSQYV